MSEELIRLSDPSGWRAAERRSSAYIEWVRQYDSKGWFGRLLMRARDQYIPSAMRKWATVPTLDHYHFLQSREYADIVGQLRRIGWR